MPTSGSAAASRIEMDFGLWAIVVYRDTSWSDALAWYPLATVIGLIMMAVFGIPILLLLKFVKTPAVVAYVLGGVAAPAFGLSLLFPYSDTWYSAWPYWISGALTGLAGWFIVEIIAVP